jgi:hypothetical protein
MTALAISSGVKLTLLKVTPIVDLPRFRQHQVVICSASVWFLFFLGTAHGASCTIKAVLYLSGL